VSKSVKYLLYFLAFDALVAAAWFGLKALKGGAGGAAAVDWVTIDESYAPKNAVEEFIKNDAEVRGALPVEIRNYGRDKKVLGRFKGRQFAQPTENILNMFFKGRGHQVQERQGARRPADGALHLRREAVDGGGHRIADEIGAGAYV
jgi:hypothetical protein